MSSKIAILSLVSAVLAVPHNHGHQHLHKRQYGYYPAGNSTVLPVVPSTGAVAPATTLDATTVVTDYSTVISYVTLTRPAAATAVVEGGQPVEDAAAPAASSAGDACGAVVTLTSTNVKTVYVTAGEVAASSVVSPEQPASSGGYEAPGPAPSSVVAAEPTPVSSFVVVEPTPTPTPEPTSEVASSAVFTLAPEPSSAVVVVPEPSSEAPVSSVAPVTPEPSSAVEVPAPATSVAEATPTPSAVTPPSNGGYGTGKRGLAYNDASLCTAFASSNAVSWAYNWAQTSDGLDPSFQYVPMLWGDKNEFADTWETNAKASIDSGVPYVLGMNEPDHAEQALMDTGVAADFYRTHLTSLKSYNSGVQLGSPAVTNGGGEMGLTWLGNFMSACSDCQVDFCAVHWYDSADNIQYFKDHMTQAHDTCGGKPIWVTEFGVNGGSTDQVSAFLEDVMAWMDTQSWIERYSYFMVDDAATGIGNNVLGTLYSTFDALVSKA